MTDTFSYMTEHPYATSLTTAVVAPIVTSAVAQALETLGITVGLAVLTGIAATLSMAAITGTALIKAGADIVAEKLHAIIVDKTSKKENGNIQNNNNKSGVAVILDSKKDNIISKTRIDDVKKDETSSIKDEHVALGRALATVGLFSTPRAHTAAIESMHTPTPTRVS